MLIIRRLKAAWLAFKNPYISGIKDGLTGVFTRAAFKLLAECELEKAKRGQSLVLVVVFCDLDDLKFVNDTYGHKTGDRYLKEFAEVATKVIRRYDYIARWGGDEFVLLLSGIDSAQVEKIITRINAQFPHFSWGMSCWRPGYDYDLDALIAEADTEMYRQKLEKKKK